MPADQNREREPCLHCEGTGWVEATQVCPPNDGPCGECRGTGWMTVDGGPAEPTPTPTDLDLSRDLLADLALCEAATPGPWDVLDSRREPYYFIAPNGDRPKEGCVEWQMLGDWPEGRSSDFGRVVLHGTASPHQIPPRLDDLAFIVAAREGWPAAIRCALAASAALDAERAENARLVKLLDVANEHFDAADRFLDERDEARAQLAAAQAEIRRLQGIVEGLTERVAAQSELLSARAEKGPAT